MPPAKRKTPLRMCVGCRQMLPKKELVRIVRSPEGEIGLDNKGGKAPGRGAYLCGKRACLERAKKTRALERALEHQVSEEVYALLKEGLSDDEP